MANRVEIFISILLSGLLLHWIWRSGTRVPSIGIDDILDGITMQPELAEFTLELEEREIIKVTDGVYVAVNYAMANSIMLEGRDGLVIVDTTESVESARQILAAFRNITSKPIKAIVYTHNHADHVYGTEGFIENGAQPPDVWAYHTLTDIWKENLIVGPKMRWGIVHQFGTSLRSQQSSGAGKEFVAKINTTRSVAAVSPNKLIRTEYEQVEIAGMQITFVHVPGETPDHIAVWLPDKKVLLAADDIYKTFPNLYAIRGTAPRDTITWVNSLRKIRNLHPEFLVPSHLRPITGRKEIFDLLTVYSSGIQFIHDQTVRRMNQLYHPDEIAKIVTLPKSLASHPYLQQFYGTTGWSTKAVYERYIGWFSGDPVDLQAFTPTERSERLVSLVGVGNLLEEGEASLKSGDFQWALELSSHVFRLDSSNHRARDIRLQALRSLAAVQTNPLARNFYMTTALNDNNLIDWSLDMSAIVENSNMEVLLNFMKIRLVAELADNINTTVCIKFDDTKETFRLQVLYSVLTVDKVDDGESVVLGGNDGDMILSTSTTVWRNILMQRLSSAMAYASGALIVEKGSLLSLRQFFSLFQEPAK